MKLYNKEELKNSRIFFDKQPRKYLSYLGYFFLIGILFSLLLLKYLPKNYIVKAQGTIEANDKFYITPLTTANIVEVLKEEGSIVKRGDPLLTLSSGSERTQEEEIEKKIIDSEKQVEIFNKFEQSLKEKKNLLKNESEEQEYYGKVDYYLMQLNDDKKKNESLVIDLQGAKNELVILQNELEGIDNIEYEKYLKDYTRKNEDLEKKQTQKRTVENTLPMKENTDFKDSLRPDKDSEIDLDTSESESEILSEEIKILQRELIDIKEQYEDTLKTNKKSKNEEIKNKEQEIRNFEIQESSQAINTYQQLISELGTARAQNIEKISELKSQKKIKSVNNDFFSVVANKDGVLHYMTPIKTGLGLQAFQPIAQIDSGVDSKLIVEGYISAQDRSRVNIGDYAKVSISGVNQTKYGLLKGKVTEISTGTISQETSDKSQQLLYQVTILLMNTELKNKKETIKAQASMPVTANIIYDNETYLEWILNELNLKK